MKINEKLLRQIIEEVVAEVAIDSECECVQKKTIPPVLELPNENQLFSKTDNLRPVCRAELKLLNEIVIAVGPAFASHLSQNVIGIPHRQILREICQGIEQENMAVRIVRLLDSADAVSLAYKGCQISLSGIAIGIQSDGATIIQQKNCTRVFGLDAFADAAQLLPLSYRYIAINAARYAKGLTTEIVPMLCNREMMLKHQLKSLSICDFEMQFITNVNEIQTIEFH